ncbi:MAG: RNA polymerase sigma factor [Bacteroidota bacterium]
MLEDNKLVELCLKNSKAGFEELYKRFSAKMFGVCLRYSRNYHDAEDLMHEGFIRVFEKLKDFRSEGSFEGWLRKVMVSTAINFYHKNKTNHIDVEITEVPSDIEIFESTYSYISTKELLNYIHNLPDGYRMVFNLYVIEGYKHTEIAEIMNISESTSKSQFMKARNYLKKMIMEVAYEKVI